MRLRRRGVALALLLLLVPAVVIGSYAFYLADSSGMLPWQEDPTRIPITPFADIPGFSVPTPLPTPVTAGDEPMPAAGTSRLQATEEMTDEEPVAWMDISRTAVRAG